MSKLSEQRANEAVPKKSGPSWIWMVAVVVIVVAAWVGYDVYHARFAKVSTLDGFAQCLTAKGAQMYGAWWCPHCADQKELFNYVLTMDKVQKVVAATKALEPVAKQHPEIQKDSNSSDSDSISAAAAKIQKYPDAVAVLAEVPAHYFDAWTFTQRRIGLSPSGREVDLRLFADRSLGAYGSVRLEATAASQVGNVAGAPPGLGLLASWRVGV